MDHPQQCCKEKNQGDTKVSGPQSRSGVSASKKLISCILNLSGLIHCEILKTDQNFTADLYYDYRFGRKNSVSSSCAPQWKMCCFSSRQCQTICTSGIENEAEILDPWVWSSTSSFIFTWLDTKRLQPYPALSALSARETILKSWPSSVGIAQSFKSRFFFLVWL